MMTEKEKINKVFKIANNSIYFGDNDNYLSALYEICKVISVENVKEFGIEYLEE